MEGFIQRNLKQNWRAGRAVRVAGHRGFVRLEYEYCLLASELVDCELSRK